MVGGKFSHVRLCKEVSVHFEFSLNPSAMKLYLLVLPGAVSARVQRRDSNGSQYANKSQIVTVPVSISQDSKYTVNVIMVCFTTPLARSTAAKPMSSQQER